MEKVSRVDVNLSKELGLPVPEQIPIVPVISPKDRSDVNLEDADKDYREVRENLKRIISQSEEATQGILEVAQESQNPRAYEVVAQLISATLEANNKLIHLHKQVKEIKREEEGSPKTVTNNAIFVGNTADLQKMIRDMRKKELPDATQTG